MFGATTARLKAGATAFVVSGFSRTLLFVAVFAATGPAAVREHLVRLDAIVSDARGHAVETLTANDFEITEDGAPRAVDGVQFVRPAAGQSRRFGIFLDEYYVS